MKKSIVKTLVLPALCLAFVGCGDAESALTDIQNNLDSVTTNIDTTVEDAIVVEKMSHEKWDGLLKKYVNGTGMVDYEGFKADAELVAYTEMFKTTAPDDSWSEEESKAYWMNAYNAFTVKLICDNYPLESIMDLDGGKVWDREWVEINGETHSLGHIENNILRTNYNDPRIHFGINCASYSCPPLLNEAFTAENQDEKLEVLAHDFVNDPNRNDIEAVPTMASNIFNWYAADFTKEGTVIDYMNKYSHAMLDGAIELSYMEYDWSLNKQ